MKSKLLLTVDHHFLRTPDGKVWVKTIYGYDFFKRYLDVFECVRVVGRVRDVQEINEKMLEASGDRVEFFSLPEYRGTKEFIKKYFLIKRDVRTAVEGCSCAIFRIPSPIADMVRQRVIKNNLPWGTEIVNDPWDNFAPGVFKSVLRPVYRRAFTNQVKKYAKSANGVSYVTEYALQNRYPSYARIHGEDRLHFESYYSSIRLTKDFFFEERSFPKDKNIFTVVHINSCITDYSKGHDVVIKTVKALNERGIPVKAKFIGDGPMRKFFCDFAENLGIGDKVEFTGLLSSAAEVRAELIRSDILVFPTLGEGLPRTVIEAMAVGLPCLSTAVNGIPELLENKYLINQQDVEGFANAAERLLTDEKAYMSAVEQNLSKALEYENAILQNRRNEFYQKLKNLIV